MFSDDEMQPALKNKKARSKKTSKQQYLLYVEELKNNVTFKNNPLSDPQAWEKLTIKLNSAGRPIRDAAGWKRIFSEWKCHVRNKARKIKISHQETRNKAGPETPLNGIEERLLSITGKVAVDGLNITEAGLAIQEETASVENEEPAKIAEVSDYSTSQPKCQQQLLVKKEEILLLHN